jgi:hypothetical protein
MRKVVIPMTCRTSAHACCRLPLQPSGCGFRRPRVGSWPRPPPLPLPARCNLPAGSACCAAALSSVGTAAYLRWRRVLTCQDAHCTRKLGVPYTTWLSSYCSTPPLCHQAHGLRSNLQLCPLKGILQSWQHQRHSLCAVAELQGR